MWLSQHLFYQTSSLWNGAMRNIHHISSKKIKWMEIVQVDNPIGNNNLKVICLLTCAGQGDFNSIFCRGISMDSGSFDSPSRGMIYAKKGIICWLKISEQLNGKVWWMRDFHTSLGLHQCWSGIIFFLYYSGIYNEDFTSFDTSMVLDGIFVFDTVRVYTMQEPTYLCKSA